MKDNLSRVKISDIAQRAGVSTGTVDRVLHNRGEVSKKTRDKVLSILDELNYQPDILASTLAMKKTYRFATLFPEAGTENLFWKAPLAGLNTALSEIAPFGVTLSRFLFKYNDQSSFNKQLEKIVSEPYDGVILTPVFYDSTSLALEKLAETNTPVVFINSNIENLGNLSFVGQDARQSGLVAGRLMDYSLNVEGCITIINFINEKGGNSHILNREEGFRSYFESGNFTKPRHLNTLNIYTHEQEEVNRILLETIGTDNPICKTMGVFVTNSRVFRVANFKKGFGLSNLILVGYDLLESNIDHLKKNNIDFLISQNPWEQGYKSLMALFNSRIMKKEIMKNQFLPIDIITKENIDYYLNN
ncbi:MAG: substrate-binding domain-containing protein [Tenuifilaceae bacterium]|jgi:LacI family transcriptional regulator|nr:substrate-binding domain-containing protein [Tenuifilaceae bacterium]